MISHRPFSQLGHFQNEWLNAHYHFSFADYFDPARMGLGALRVWNDDIIAPQTGFPPHPHRDMEIVTYLRQGVITHQDSLGNQGRTHAGQVQVMSAGTGIRHAEYNLEDQDTILFQIWILPDRKGLPPRWETNPFPRSRDRLDIMASGMGEDGVPPIFQKTRVLGGHLSPGLTLSRPLDLPHAYLVASQGVVTVNGIRLTERDAIALSHQDRLELSAQTEAEIVLVETI